MTTATPTTDKQLARAALDQMPETATLEEMAEELAILAAIQQGEADIVAGRVVSHEEVVRRSATWISK
jgi:predicted transcriptional regulator